MSNAGEGTTFQRDSDASAFADVGSFRRRGWSRRHLSSLADEARRSLGFDTLATTERLRLRWARLRSFRG